MAVINCNNPEDVLKFVKDRNVSFIQFWFTFMNILIAVGAV